MLVYNCTTGGINPFFWGEMGKVYFKTRTSQPSIAFLGQALERWLPVVR